MRKEYFVFFGITIFLGAQISFAQGYSLTEVGAVNDSALALSNGGQVVGRTSLATGTNPFLWENGTTFNLSTSYGGMYNAARDVNDYNEAVGSSFTPVGDLFPGPDNEVLPFWGTYSRALMWQGGEAFDLGNLPGYTVGFANGINNNSQVVGASYNFNYNSSNNGTAQAFLWDARSGIMALGFLPGHNQQCCNRNQ